MIELLNPCQCLARGHIAHLHGSRSRLALKKLKYRSRGHASGLKHLIRVSNLKSAPISMLIP